MQLEAAPLELRDSRDSEEHEASSFFVAYDVTLHRFSPPQVTSGVSEELGRKLIELMGENHRAWLAERWERARGQHETGRIPAGWKPGELAAYTDIFPRGWDLEVNIGDSHYLAEDSYCLRPDCSCSEIGLAFYALPDGSSCGVARTSLPALRVTSSEYGGRRERDRLQRLIDRIGRDKLRERFRRVRAFAASLRRGTAPAAPHFVAGEAAGGALPVDQKDRCYQLRVHLLETEPAVWRRLEVRGDQTLSQVARAIAGSLGWSFDMKAPFIRVDARAPAFDAWSGAPLDRSSTIASAAESPGVRLFHGRSDRRDWTFDILVEAVRPLDRAARYPRVIDGESARPPETCRGPEEYELLREAFDRARDPDHEHAVALLGEAFDPNVMSEPPDAEVGGTGADVPVNISDIERVLDTAGPLLMQRTIAAISALPGAGPALVEIVSRGVASEARPTWSLVQAVRLLHEIAFVAAIDILLAAVARFSDEERFGVELGFALSAMEDAALEPVLRAYAARSDVRQRTNLRLALANMNVVDERILEILLDALARQDPHAAADLLSYGDPAAIAPLEAELNRLIDDGSTGALDASYGVTDAIEALGGELSAETIDRLAALETSVTAREKNSADVSEAPSESAGKTRVVVKRPGRNDPCWCGSGKKYKKCHLGADELAHRPG